METNHPLIRGGKVVRTGRKMKYKEGWTIVSIERACPCTGAFAGILWLGFQLSSVNVTCLKVLDFLWVCLSSFLLTGWSWQCCFWMILETFNRNYLQLCLFFYLLYASLSSIYCHLFKETGKSSTAIMYLFEMKISKNIFCNIQIAKLLRNWRNRLWWQTALLCTLMGQMPIIWICPFKVGKDVVFLVKAG